LFALGLKPKKELAGPYPEPTQFPSEKKEAHPVGACGLACQSAVQYLPLKRKNPAVAAGKP